MIEHTCYRSDGAGRGECTACVDRERILGAIALLGDEGVDTDGWTDADLIAWYDRHRVERVTCERTRDAVHPDEALDELVLLERAARSHLP